MKKLIALLLSALLVLSLTACEKEDVDLALDIAVAVLEELESYENAEADTDVLPEYADAGAESVVCAAAAHTRERKKT